MGAVSRLATNRVPIEDRAEQGVERELAGTRVLEQVFGQGDDNVVHAPHSFALGGNADAVAFHHHIEGVVYVTAELSGKPDACYADSELMICHRNPQDWGPNIISRLAPYTRQTYIGTGESMDIDAATPPESQIKAFLFNTYATFTLFGNVNELRLCIGITKPELLFKMERGADRLQAVLKAHVICPYTVLDRKSLRSTASQVVKGKMLDDWTGKLAVSVRRGFH